MYCKKCGNYIANGIDKCPMCGWVVGEEIVEEEKAEEVVEKKKIDILRFVFDILGLAFVAFVAFVMLTYKFINHNGDISELYYFLANKSKDADLFDAAKNYDTWFKINDYPDAEAFILFKIILCFLTLAFSCIYVIIFVVNTINIFKGKEKIKEGFPILAVIYALAITGYYSYAKPRVALTFIFTACIIVLAICNVVRSFKKKEITKGILPYVIISIILVYIAVYLLQLKVFGTKDDYYTNAEFIYIISRVDKANDVKTIAIGSPYINIFTCLFISTVPSLFITLKKESKINSLSYVSVALPLINLLVSIFACVQLEKKNYLDGMKINVVYIFATVLAVLAGILCVVAYIANYKEYKKTKVYNL